MDLQKRSRKTTLGFLEIVLFACLCICLLTGLLCWHGAATASWQSTPLLVASLSMVGNRGTAADDDAHIEISFTYTVEGRTHTGHKLLNRIERALFGTLPDEVMALLRERGFLSFGDLPPEAQALLRERGIMSFSEIPIPMLELFNDKQPASLEDVPEEVVAAARNKDYDALTKVLDQEFAKVNFESSPGNATTHETQGVSITTERRKKIFHAGSTVAADAGVQGLGVPLMRVFYDPENPTHYRVSAIPIMKQGISITLFAVCMTLTLVYSAVLYPRLVREYRR